MARWREEQPFQEQEQQEEEQWEKRTLNLLKESRIDREFSEAKARKKGGKKRHKLKLMKRPMAVPEVILELLDERLRENAVRTLSNFLLGRWEIDRRDYYQAGFMLFHSCSTMSLLLQEVMEFLVRMADDSLNIRAIKRLENVLTLFQSVAAHDETRKKFVQSCIPNYLVPIVLFKSETGVFENIQTIALSVIGILCQGREPEIILWAIESDIVEVCNTVLKTGNELSKVISMHILEYILRDAYGIYFICHPDHSVLEGLMDTWKQLITLLAEDQDFSPRLLFHILRCYALLCVHSRGILIVVKCLPSEIRNNALYDVSQEFPVIKCLLLQLLLTVDWITDLAPGEIS